MRAYTNLRTAFRFGMMLTAAAGISFAAADARADVAPPSGKAPAGEDNVSSGTGALKFEHAKGLDTSIDTGFRGFSYKGVTAEVRAVVKLDPVKNAGPLYTIDMQKGAMVEASWAGDKKIVLRTKNGAETDGSVAVRHSLTPSLEARVSGFGASATFSYDANKLMAIIQAKAGTAARFLYDSKKTQTFQPWGFTTVDTNLDAPELDKSALFTLGMDRFPELISKNFDGEVGVRAVTKPKFSYKTTSVVMAGADGKIAQNGGEVVVDAQDGDFLEQLVTVQGEMTVTGDIQIQPFVHFERVPGFENVDITLPITAYAAKYTVPKETLDFQAITVHIPLPNVHAPTEGVDLGAVKAKGSASKTVTITNSGEKAAAMTFKSSNPSFSVPSERVVIEPKGSYELTVRFDADSAGPALAEVTVMSNDPDSPEQMFKIGANGADVGNDKDGDPAKAAEESSGCGCKTTGQTSLPSYAGYALLGLGTIAFVRRRKAAKK